MLGRQVLNNHGSLYLLKDISQNCLHHHQRLHHQFNYQQILLQTQHWMATACHLPIISFLPSSSFNSPSQPSSAPLLPQSLSSQFLGIWLNAHVRIATELTHIHLDAHENYIPGLSFLLSRQSLDNEYQGRHSGSMSKYLALTGTPLSGMETVLSGMATHYIPSDRMENLFYRLSDYSESGDLRDISVAVQDYSDSAPSLQQWNEWRLGIPENRIVIEKCFQFDNLDKIVSSLQKCASNQSSSSVTKSFIQETLESLETRTTTTTSNNNNNNRSSDLISSTRLSLESILKLMVHSRSADMWSAFQQELEMVSDTSPSTSTSSTSNLSTPTPVSIHEYTFQKITGLPSELDIRQVVIGEVGGGEMALTLHELINYFAAHWGIHSAGVPELPKPGAGNIVAEGDGKDLDTMRRDNKIMWGLSQRIQAVVERKCRYIDGKYLKWK